MTDKSETDHPIVEAIIEATGAVPGDKIEIVTPQFHRAPTDPVPGPQDDLAALRTMSPDALLEMGMKRWNAILWLYPGEWYRTLPAGLGIIDIFGNEEHFVPGVTDDDIRFGCLPFGFVRDEDLPRLAERRDEDWD